MDAVYVGWLSILPPMIAIILALITKEVLFSLIAGVLSGTIIYSIASGMNPIVGPVSTVFDVMIQKADMNIIIFCFFVGRISLSNQCFWRSSSLWKMGIKNHSYKAFLSITY